LREQDREAIGDVGDVLLSTPTGQVVPAKNVLLLNREAGPVQIQRKNMERMTTVNAEIEVPLSQAVASVQSRLGQLRVPPDSPSASVRSSRNRLARSSSCSWC
jgi:multidrug efflux pump subunit AcrB